MGDSDDSSVGDGDGLRVRAEVALDGVAVDNAAMDGVAVAGSVVDGVAVLGATVDGVAVDLHAQTAFSNLASHVRTALR